MLLSAQFTIGALMKNLDASGSGQILGYRDAAEQRVVVTYQDVPTAGTSEPNTLQIAIVAGGHTPIADLRDTDPIVFSELRDGSVFVPFDMTAAIFEQFETGTERSCKR